MIWLALLALYLSPLGLLVFFEVYAFGRRSGKRWLEWVGLVGLPSDIFCAAVWLRFLWPTGRTVTARATFAAQDALHAVRAGRLPSMRGSLGLALAGYLNARDPGHCPLN